MAKQLIAKISLTCSVPVVGSETIRVATDAGLRVIAVEAGKTLFLKRDEIADLASAASISIVGR